MTDTELEAEVLGVLNSTSFMATRKLRPDLTPEEKERLEKYGSIDFKSAGAIRKR